MKQFLKRISLILIAFFALASIISEGSLWILRKSSFYKSTFLTNTIKDKQLDYIILGASTGLTTLNTKIIDSMLITNGLNLAMDDTSLPSQYLMLQHFLAEGKSAKFCILALSAPSFDTSKDGLSGNDYRFLMYKGRSYVSEYYKNHNGKQANVLYVSKWLSMFGMSYYNTELFYPSLISLVKPKKRNRFDDKGNYAYPDLKLQDKPITKFNKIEIGFTNTYVKKIDALCKLNNIELVCYLSPMKAQQVATKFSNHNVINHSSLLTNTKYFYDAVHVNYLGAQISSINFAQEFEAIYNKRKQFANE